MPSALFSSSDLIDKKHVSKAEWAPNPKAHSATPQEMLDLPALGPPGMQCYGYSAENRHLVRPFLHGTKPALTFEDGLEVVKLLMAAYQSAEQGRTINLPVRGLESYKPLVARGKWKP